MNGLVAAPARPAVRRPRRAFAERIDHAVALADHTRAAIAGSGGAFQTVDAVLDLIARYGIAEEYSTTS